MQACGDVDIGKIMDHYQYWFEHVEALVNRHLYQKSVTCTV